MWTIPGLLCLVAASEAPRAERRRLEVYNYQEVAKLTAADGGAYDEWKTGTGTSLAIDGDTVVVGATQKKVYGSDGPGSVYVFRTTDGGATYVEVAKLTAADGAAGDKFGISVAIDGDTVVVGANGDDSGRGSAYVFRTSDGGATYGQVAKLTASDAAMYDSFGISVAIAGDTVVAGAYYKTYPAGEGAVYVFRTSDGGATYAQVAKLTASDGEGYDYFGYSVASDGDTIVVGAYGDGWGSAYVFRMTDGGATYDQVAKLTASDGASYDDFGKSVAIDGGTVVVGAWGDDAAYNSASAYVFDANAPTSQPTPQPTPQPTSQPTGQPTPAPTPEPKPRQQQQLDLLGTILICVAAAVVIACGLAYARYVRSAKEESPSTTTADPTKLHEVHGRMVGWYEGQVALRQRWGPFPTRPELLETWPGFVPVTNAFADATDGPPSTEVLPAEESAPEEEDGWGARGLQRLAFWRTEDPPEEEEMRAEIATPTEEEV